MCADASCSSVMGCERGSDVAGGRGQDAAEEEGEVEGERERADGSTDK